MKKFLISLIAVVSAALTANAISLFPHFVDVAGDYNDGTTEKFIQLNIPTQHWRSAPAFFKSINDADNFLNDTLPFSNYEIPKSVKTLDDGTQIIIYSTSLEADGINKGKFSYLYLIQTPGEPLLVGVFDDPI